MVTLSLPVETLELLDELAESMGNRTTVAVEAIRMLAKAKGLR